MHSENVHRRDSHWREIRIKVKNRMNFCRHFVGGFATHCKMDVNLEEMRRKSPDTRSLPCLRSRGCSDLCEYSEFPGAIEAWESVLKAELACPVNRDIETLYWAIHQAWDSQQQGQSFDSMCILCTVCNAKNVLLRFGVNPVSLEYKCSHCKLHIKTGLYHAD